MKMKCTSRNIEKARMKVTISSSFKKTKMLVKIKHADIKKNIFTFKLINFSKDIMKATSSQKFKTILFPCKSYCTNAHKKCEEYLINNLDMKKNILEFKSVAETFVKLYNMKNDKKIIFKNDNAYLILKYNEKRIKNIDYFRAMKVEEVIDDQLFYSLSCL